MPLGELVFLGGDDKLEGLPHPLGEFGSAGGQVAAAPHVVDKLLPVPSANS